MVLKHVALAPARQKQLGSRPLSPLLRRGTINGDINGDVPQSTTL